MSPFLRLGYILLPILLALPATAADQRTFTKTGASTATVIIKTESTDSIQAATYVDGQENSQFVQMMLADKTSLLAQTKAKLEMENCGENSNTPDGYIPTCGQVEISAFVQTDFGRGGWMEGGASYTFFIGFRSVGSGHSLESSYMASFDEDVEAEVDSQMNYLGRVFKKLSLQRIIAIPVQ